MAASTGIWGVEIGQTALKALHCSVVDGEVVADAIDYIEYPTILSQPESDADELVADALEQLLQNHESATDNVVVSIPGQSGLAKFFKPPPVEVKKVADIVRYEARQQIPFDLDEVVWDYQMMPGSMVEEGYALESEVGLFAMKRNQAFSAIEPFEDAGIEVDAVQLAPIALYNMIAYDQLSERVEADIFDPDDPPPSLVLLSIGTDSSDLIVTNGFRIWQRSMPIGGNHFTRQLTKDLKLTFAKAEHLKRNARDAEDPKLVFQTMRPVFNDLVTEVQRSIGFFRSIDKKAEIGEMLLTGNTVKMPGLAAYLGKNLGLDVRVLDKFERLHGDDVLSLPTFRDNSTTFSVCYGLCLQGLKQSQINASLVPREIVRDRLVRSKKPWALAGLAALLLGMTAHYAFTEMSWATTHPDLWDTPISRVDDMSTYRQGHVDRDNEYEAKLKYLNKMGEEVAGNTEHRLKWLEIIRVVNSLIPRTEWPDGELPSVKDVPLEERQDIHVTSFDSKHFKKVQDWWTPDIKSRFAEEMRNWSQVTGKELPKGFDTTEGPKGDAYVLEIQCYHYYNANEREGFKESDHVRRVLTTAFLEGKVKLPVGVDADGNEIFEEFTMEEMGLSYPLLLDDNKAVATRVRNPDYDPALKLDIPGGAAGPGNDDVPDFEKPTLSVKKLDFVFQVVWHEKVLGSRMEAKEKARKAAGTSTDDSVAAVP